MAEWKGAILSDRGTVRVTGAEAVGFLQGLVTADMQALAAGQASLAALLTPQGKIMFDFLILRADGGFLIDCRADMLAELMKRLAFYRLRAKVELADERESLAVVALWGGEGDVEAEDFFPDPRHAALGLRAILPCAQAEARLAAAGAEIVSPADYRRHRIRAGIPEGGADFPFGETFPHEADMDKLGGVSFTKGCFVGQEVVSRIEHRGTARSRILPVEINGAAPAPGTEIRAGDKAIGTLGSVEDGRGLALLRLDRLEAARAAGEAIMAGEAAITPLQPVWERGEG